MSKREDDIFQTPSGLKKGAENITGEGLLEELTPDCMMAQNKSQFALSEGLSQVLSQRYDMKKQQNSQSTFTIPMASQVQQGYLDGLQKLKSCLLEEEESMDEEMI